MLEMFEGMALGVPTTGKVRAVQAGPDGFGGAAIALTRKSEYEFIRAGIA